MTRTFDPLSRHNQDNPSLSCNFARKYPVGISFQLKHFLFAWMVSNNGYLESRRGQVTVSGQGIVRTWRVLPYLTLYRTVLVLKELAKEIFENLCWKKRKLR